MEEADLNSIILNFIHSKTGWGKPLRPRCEFEDLYLDEIDRLPEDKIKVSFRYFFDEDGFSQYDKTHGLEGGVVINATGDILESTLKEVHTGVAANRDPYGLQRS
jgi:hypothetical protein